MPSHDGSLLRMFPQDRLYITGTMRSEPDTSEQRAWPKEHNVSVIHLVRMSDDIIFDFALKTAEDLGIRLSNETLTAVVTTNDRRPQVVCAALRLVRNRGYSELSSEQGERVARAIRLGNLNMWQQHERPALASSPEVRALLEALERFYAARQVMFVDLVTAFARRRHGWVWLQRKKKWRVAHERLLSHEYFREREGVYLVEEIALEGAVEEKEAIQELTDCAHHFRWLTHRAGLRWLNGLRDAQKWLALKLGNLYTAGKEPSEDDLDRAIALYDRAAAIGRSFHEALYNWGNALHHSASLLAELKRHKEALAAWGEAESRYARAVEIKPDKHEALSNWGIALDRKASLLARLDRTDQALAAWGEAEARYAKAVKNEPDKHEALNNWGVSLNHKASLLARVERTEEALAAREEARRLMSRAAQIIK